MNKHKTLAVMTAAVVVILSGMPALAQNSSRHLVIGTREVPPFAMTDENGRWTGITIDLWEKIADRLGYSYEYQSFSL